MSYVRSFHHTEPVHGTVTVHYPASESGGTITASYTDYASVTVNVMVETSPFDSSISVAKRNSDILTGAIAGMETAQIAAIRKSATQVSDSMIHGFYSMIRKDISSQQSEKFAELQSKHALLMETFQVLSDKMERMDDDVARLQRHYSALFQEMDETLQKRLVELNRPSFQLAEKARQEIVIQPYITSGALGIEQTNETNRSQGMLTNARIRKKISDVLTNVSDYIMKYTDYKNDVNGILSAQASPNPERECVPTIICEQRSMNMYGNKDSFCVVPKMPAGETISNAMNQCASANVLPWKNMDPRELAQIDQAFTKYVEDASRNSVNDPKEARVYEQMLRMWKGSRDNIKSL